MTSELTTAMTSGSFLTTVKSQPTLAVVTSASTVVDVYTVMTVITPTPAPTASPTITAVIPSVSQLSLSAYTKTTLTLSATLIKKRIVSGDVSGGYLYCIAMSSGSAPSSIGSVKSAITSSSTGTLKTFPIGSIFPLTLTVSFSGLLALKAYSVYCYVETLVGTGSALYEVLGTKTVVTTACCKTLSFTNSPAFVYGDVSKYTTSSSTLYIYTYSLSAAPSIDLQVTPAFQLDGVVTTAITAIPSTFTMTQTSQLTGQFFLSATSALVGGTCTMTMVISGSSAAQYDSGVTAVVQILSSQSAVPAPVMLTSRFSDSGQAVLITFDSTTDMAGEKVKF
jgi:hypothetical protein